ncbi:hypothetical protein AMTRI_Chr02g213420 [Amborella trichopoda]
MWGDCKMCSIFLQMRREHKVFQLLGWLFNSSHAWCRSCDFGRASAPQRDWGSSPRTVSCFLCASKRGACLPQPYELLSLSVSNHINFFFPPLSLSPACHNHIQHFALSLLLVTTISNILLSLSRLSEPYPTFLSVSLSRSLSLSLFYTHLHKIDLQAQRALG